MRAVLFLVLAILSSMTPLQAGEPASARPEQLPGVALARTVTEITGVAISPMLGVSTVGAWTWLRTPAASRGRLPWYCLPAVWGSGLALAGLCFLKDSLGAAAPSVLKKPLDLLELFENKASGLVACGAFVPFVIAQLTGSSSPTLTGGGGGLGLAVVGLNPEIVALPLAMLGFAIVWLAAHSVTVLAALCPFGVVSAALKLLRTAVLGMVAALAVLNPWVGMAFCALLLVLCALAAPWCFRLTVFGTLLGLDLLLPWWGAGRRDPREPHAFLACALEGVPARTWGRLRRTERGVAFVWRPCLLLPERAVPLLPGELACSRGLLFPSVLHGAPLRPVIHLLPRYRTVAEAVAAEFALGAVREHLLRRGFQTVRLWFTEVAGIGSGRLPASAR